MDQQLMQALENFETVWRRVSGGGEKPAGRPKPPRPPEDRLRSLLEQSRRTAADLAALARRAPRRLAPALAKLAAGQREDARRLHVESFLHTGTLSPPAPYRPAAEAFLPALRRAWLETGEAAGALDRAGRETDDPRLAALYGELARSARAREEALRRLISAALG